MAEREANKAANESFLPDLCGIKSLLTVLIVAQLLAFVLVLADWDAARSASSWDQLGLVSLFVHWVALTSVALLCFLRRWLKYLKPVAAGLVSYGVVLLLTFLLSLIVTQLKPLFGEISGSYWQLIFALKNTLISAIVSAVALRFIYLGHKQTQTSRAQSLAHIQALQARIRPHFLFNCMNTIAALIGSNPKNAETVVENLADLFRQSLGDADERVPLVTELDTARQYLEIEQFRLGDRLRLEWQIEEIPAGTKVPRLLLQPLLENAVYYGIEPRPEGGVIKISCKVADKQIDIVIENPYIEQAKTTRQGNKMAMENIRERLSCLYGSRGQLYLLQKDDKVSVILSLPCEGVDDEYTHSG